MAQAPRQYIDRKTGQVLKGADLALQTLALQRVDVAVQGADVALNMLHSTSKAS